MRTTTRNRTAIIAALAIAALLASAAAAHALIVVNDTPTLVVSNPVAGEVASYTFGTYLSEGNERPRWFRITFPEGADVSGAYADGPPGTVQVSGRTVTVTFNPQLGGNVEFTVTIAGIVNPATPGVYSFPDAIVQTRNPGGQQPVDHPVPVPNVTILGSEPYLSITLSTSEIAFELYPETPAPPQQVHLTVDSSHDFTVTREVSGEADFFGLSVTGNAEGSKPAGNATFTDDYTASVPWTTEGDRDYTATVTYTVVQ